MQTIRQLSVALSVGALAFAGSAFAKGKPNCDVNGKQMHVKNQKSCEKKSGKWMEAAGGSSTAASSTTTTPSTAPASTSPTATTK